MNRVPTRCEFCNCHLCDINPTLILFSNETCFHLRGYVNAAENLLLGHKAPVPDITICVCRECNCDYWAHFPSCDHKFTSTCYTHFTILTRISDYNKTCVHLQQGSTTVNTTNNYVPYLDIVCGHRVTWKRLWPLESPHLNLWDRFLLVGHVKGWNVSQYFLHLRISGVNKRHSEGSAFSFASRTSMNNMFMR
jgi:hypothetical protein